MYAEYLENDRELRRWNSELYKPFPNTVFAATTINYGPQTISEDHVDDKNYGPGSCAISNVGGFDDTKGGELFLWNLGLVVRFPAASSAILLSAVIRHSNLPIQPEERRYSVVQYSAGALFRFRYNGFRNDKKVLEGAKAQERAEWRRASHERWKTSLGKFRLWKTD
ncbi:hypothetical protein EV361DRAFT_940861 [Lentinula raphanica]|uniref:Uncharacterized protein n=1 Tax=Lentinula raphanica TaxID=153919 RepID=A0AA38U524_9AGAR|nr:hypothetical protein F5878DRAFT_634980 [Lentinula raphanica]KAJ3964939.1 hypothetical protein EV361DRAFT_940861 [Lentinula raphanica]